MKRVLSKRFARRLAELQEASADGFAVMTSRNRSWIQSAWREFTRTSGLPYAIVLERSKFAKLLIEWRRPLTPLGLTLLRHRIDAVFQLDRAAVVCERRLFVHTVPIAGSRAVMRWLMQQLFAAIALEAVEPGAPRA